MGTTDYQLRPKWTNRTIWAKDFNSLGLIISTVTQGGNPTAIFTPGTVPTGVISHGTVPTVAISHGSADTLTSLTLIEGTPNTLSAATITQGSVPTGVITHGTVPTIVISHGSTGTIAVTVGTADTVASVIADSDNASTTVAEINALKINGVLMNTDGMTVRTFWMVPVDMNTAHPVYMRPLWTSGSSTTADTVLWKLFHKALALNSTALSATVSTAPDTVITEDNALGTAYVMQAASAAVFNAGTFTHGACHILLVEMDTKAVGLSESLFFLGLEMLYIEHTSPDTRPDGTIRASGRPNTPPLPAGWA